MNFAKKRMILIYRAVKVKKRITMSPQRKNSIEIRILVLGFLFVCLVGGFLRSKHSEIWNFPYPQTDGDTYSPHMAQDIAVDREENIYVTGYGYCEEHDYDFITVKYDSQGRLIWVRHYDGPAAGSDYAQAMALDKEGNVYVTGHSNGIGTSLDVALVKYDKDGQELWVARYDGSFHRDDWAYDLDCDDKGHIVVAGYSFGQGTEHDWLVLKYGADGSLQWKAIYNSLMNRDDMCRALAFDGKGNAFLTGIARTQGTAYAMTTLKYDVEGGLKWTARYAGPEGAFDAGEAVGADDSGNIYVTGYGYTMETEDNLVVVSYDANGRERWLVRYDGPANLIDRGLGLAVVPKRGVCVTGTSYGPETASDSLTLCYDSEGNQIWSARYSGEGKGADVTHSIALDPESNLIVAGYSRGQNTGRDYLIIKYDPQGRQIWAKRFDGPANQDDAVTAFTVDMKGNIYVTGYSYGDKTDFDYATLKYSPDGHLLWEERYMGK